MNILYHYYVVKTLAVKAGLPANKAEKLAHYSQFIDDYNIVESFEASYPQNVNEDLLSYFIEHSYLVNKGNGKCVFTPATTGINAFKALVDSAYQRQTLVTFHFIPQMPLYELEALTPDRAQYRCRTAQNEHLICAMAQEALQKLINADDDSLMEDYALMELGMVLHTYCDTYAHKYFSGLHGWENNAKLVKSVNNLTKVTEKAIFDKMAAAAPAIGHACIGFSPDSCNHTITYDMKTSESDSKYSRHNIALNNTQEFMKCANAVYEMLCEYSAVRKLSFIGWDVIQADLQLTMQQAQGIKEAQLNTFWANSAVGRGVNYEYKKNRYFMLELQYDERNEVLLQPEGFSAEDLLDIYSEKGEQARGLVGASFRQLNEEFLYYNRISYERMHAMNNVYPVKTAKVQSGTIQIEQENE